MLPVDTRHPHLRRPHGDASNRAGPIFTNILLADDQSRDAEDAECAARSHAGAAGHAVDSTFRLDDPFWVLPRKPVTEVYPFPKAARSIFDDAASGLSRRVGRTEMLRVNVRYVDLERCRSGGRRARAGLPVRPHSHRRRIREHVVRWPRDSNIR